MLSNESVEKVANDVLRSALRNAGFLRAEVTAGDDDIGERALFVEAHMRPREGALSGALASEAIFRLRDGLLTMGEDRFPYLEFGFPDRETAEEDPSGSPAE